MQGYRACTCGRTVDDDVVWITAERGDIILDPSYMTVSTLYSILYDLFFFPKDLLHEEALVEQACVE